MPKTNTTTVKDLITMLQKCNPDAIVHNYHYEQEYGEQKGIVLALHGWDATDENLANTKAIDLS